MPVFAKVLKNWSEIKAEIDRKSNTTTTNNSNNYKTNNNNTALSLSTSTTSLNKLSLLSTAVGQHNINMQASQHNNNNTTTYNNDNTYNSSVNNNMLYSLKTPTSQDSRGSGSELYMGGFSSSDPSLTPNTPIHNNNTNNNTTTTTATYNNSANTAAYFTPPNFNKNIGLNTLSVPVPANPTPAHIPTLSYVFTPLGTATSSNSEVASVIPPTNLLPSNHNKCTTPAHTHTNSIHDNVHNTNTGTHSSSNAYTHKSTATPSHIANTFNLSLQAFRRNMKYPSSGTHTTNTSVYNTNTTNNNINTNNNSNNMYTPHTNSPIHKNTSSYTKNTYTFNSNTNTYTNNTNSSMYIHDTPSPRSKCLPNLSSASAIDLNLTLPSPQVTRQAIHKHTSTNNIANINDNSGSSNNYSNLNTNKRDIYYNPMQYIHRSGNICIRFAPNGFVWVINLSTHEKEKINVYNNYILFIKFVESVDICMDIVDDLINDVFIHSSSSNNNNNVTTATTASNSNTNTSTDAATTSNNNDSSNVNVYASVESALGGDI